MFTYLASELRTGDIAVRGSQAYANWAEQLLPWEQCEALLERVLRRDRPAGQRSSFHRAAARQAHRRRPLPSTPSTRRTPIS